MEIWPSGLRHIPAKDEPSKGGREFESLYLLHYNKGEF